MWNSDLVRKNTIHSIDLYCWFARITSLTFCCNYIYSLFLWIFNSFHFCFQVNWSTLILWTEMLRTMSELDRKYDVLDETTPPNAPLSAKYKRYTHFHSFFFKWLSILFIYFIFFVNSLNEWMWCVFPSKPRSFAYYTIQERLPIILTKVVDQTTRDKDEIAELFNEEVNIHIVQLYFILM